MLWLRYAVMTFLLLAGLSGTAQAENHIRAALVSQSAVPAASRAVTLAVVFTPDPGWHGYWQNPGDAGIGARFDWKLPAGITAGPAQYPIPQRLVIAGLMNHVYEQEYALIVQMKVPRGLKVGTKLPLRAHAEWLACTDKICVPESGELALDLVIGDGSIAPADQARFDGWWAKLPRPLGSTAQFQSNGKSLRIGVPYPADAEIKDPWFYALTENVVDYAAPQKVTRNGDMLVIETAATGKVTALEGVLAIGPDRGLAISATPGVVAASGNAVGEATGGFMTILLALGGAILGGLILNIMPCVFPIISLKALSLARAGGDERVAKREALAYAGGVILTCVAMGGIILGLRASGASVGWAFQLQEPRVILILLLLATAITLNLAGVFELRGFDGGQRLVDKGGAMGAFWTGVLAAFVATPCTGPFMGAALGAALVLPTAAALAIFAGLGFGLALPFLLLGFVPAFRRIMPKPGSWMGTFQRILAIPMFLTAAALVWLMGQFYGSKGLIIGAVWVVILLLTLFFIGKRQKSGKAIGLLLFAPIIALIASTLTGPFPKPAARFSIEAGALNAEAFSESRLSALRTSGKPVFLYFTADWCLTCKVNEKAAIDRDETATAFKAGNVAVLVGDWTNGDPVITRFLTAHGASGVPLYLFYPKGGGEPQQLPQVLTPGMLAALAK